MCIAMCSFWMCKNGSGYNLTQVGLHLVHALVTPVWTIEKVSLSSNLDQRLIIFGGSDVNGNAYSDLAYLEYGKSGITHSATKQDRRPSSKHVNEAAINRSI